MNAKKQSSASLAVHISNQHILPLLRDSDKSTRNPFGKIKQRRMEFNGHLFGAAADLAGCNVCDVLCAFKDPTVITSCSTSERTLSIKQPPSESPFSKQTHLRDQPLTCPFLRQHTVNKHNC